MLEEPHPPSKSTISFLRNCDQNWSQYSRCGFATDLYCDIIILVILLSIHVNYPNYGIALHTGSTLSYSCSLPELSPDPSQLIISVYVKFWFLAAVCITLHLFTHLPFFHLIPQFEDNLFGDYFTVHCRFLGFPSSYLEQMLGWLACIFLDLSPF